MITITTKGNIVLDPSEKIRFVDFAEKLSVFAMVALHTSTVIPYLQQHDTPRSPSQHHHRSLTSRPRPFPLLYYVLKNNKY